MARPRLGDSETKRLQLVITEDEVKAIDEWQHKNRVGSKSEAIRRLVQVGLRVSEDDFIKRAFLPLEGLRRLRGLVEKASEVGQSRKGWGKAEISAELETTFVIVSESLTSQTKAFTAMLSLVDEVAALQMGSNHKGQAISLGAARAEAQSVRKGYEAGSPEIEIIAVALINQKKL